MGRYKDWDNDRTIAFVRGYHLCTFVPELARNANLHERFAIVFDTYRREAKDMVFDAGIYVPMMLSLFDAIAHDHIEVVKDGESKTTSKEALETAWHGEWPEEPGPPDAIVLRRGAEPCCVIYTEYWMQVGGPDPYHDSYTFAIYTHEDRCREFRARCWSVADEIGVRVRLYEEALRRPPDGR